MEQEGLLYATYCGFGLWVCLPLIAACFYGSTMVHRILQFKCFHLALCPHPSTDLGHPGQMTIPGSMGRTTHHFSTGTSNGSECKQKWAIWKVTGIYVMLHVDSWFTYCIKLASSQCFIKVSQLNMIPIAISPSNPLFFRSVQVQMLFQKGINLFFALQFEKIKIANQECKPLWKMYPLNPKCNSWSCEALYFTENTWL